MKKCEILMTEKEGQVVAGVVELHDDGSFTSSYSDGYKIAMETVMSEDVMGIRRDRNPTAWFAGLPFKYSGLYMRAEIMAE